MQKQVVGTSGVEASRVTLGVMHINEKSRQEASAVVRTVLDRGVNFFDTANIYGGGTCSEIFGQALKDLDVKREDVIIQTKFGIFLGGEDNHIVRYDFSKKQLLMELNNELRRLQTDYVDFVLLHRPDTLMELDDIAEVFNELQAQGKVRNFGVSNLTPWQVELIQSAVDQKLQVNQLQFGIMHSHMIQHEINVNMEDEYSVDHDGGILAYSRLKKMTIQAWSPFQYGFFEGPFVDNPKFPVLNAKLQEFADKYGVSKNAIATAWILRHPAKMQIILGSMNLGRLNEMCDGGDVVLDRQDWWDIYTAAGNIIP